MRIHIAGACLALAAALPPALCGVDANTDRDALLRRVQTLERELRELKDALEAIPAAAVPAPRSGETNPKVSAPERTQAPGSSAFVTAGPSGFTIRSVDTNFVLRIGGHLQADSRFYPGDHRGGTANDSFVIRRARPILEGTLYQVFDYRLMLDFASGLTSSASNVGFVQDLFVNSRIRSAFQLQLGKFKEPVGLERLQSDANLTFVERGYPTQLVPNRDVGIQVHGDLFGSRLRYEAGIFNGVADGGSADIETADDEKDFALRLFATPFVRSENKALKGIGFGVAATYGNQEGALPSFVTPGQQKFFSYRSGSGLAPASASVRADGEHSRISPQGYYYWRSVALFGEYVISDQSLRRDAGTSSFTRARNSAWQVAASCLLTGEENSWKGFAPKNPIGLSQGGWGAWEIAGRLGQLHVDEGVFPSFANPASSASAATSWGVGLNWYLNKNVKINLDYDQTRFEGGGNDLQRKGEQAIFTRLQLSF